MSTLPSNPEDRIGKPQVIARVINIGGLQILVRLQKPFEEAPLDYFTNEQLPEEECVKYGCALVCETWSEGSKSVITEGIKRAENQTEEVFQFGLRYMMNNSTDEEIIEVLKLKGVYSRLRFQSGICDTAVVLAKPPKLEKKP